MSDIAIKAKGLGKRYRIGQQEREFSERSIARMVVGFIGVTWNVALLLRGAGPGVRGFESGIGAVPLGGTCGWAMPPGFSDQLFRDAWTER
jgi:hypothetical protein